MADGDVKRDSFGNWAPVEVLPGNTSQEHNAKKLPNMIPGLDPESAESMFREQMRSAMQQDKKDSKKFDGNASE